jgi:hypothetical protein
MLHDGYSEFKWLQALEPQDVAAGGATNGVTVDRRGYQTVTFTVNVGQYTGGGAFSADNRFQLKLEHGTTSALGVDTWSEVYPSQMLHSVVGGGGAYSTLNSGIWQSITSANVSNVYAVGYIGPRRYVRIAISEVGAPSTMSFAAQVQLGKPGIWPVQDPLPL